MDSSHKISPIESATTNVLTVSEITKVSWCNYTYTCSGDKLHSFVTSAPQRSSSSSSTEFDSLSCIYDPIIVNYLILLENGIPCTWKFKDERENNFEIVFTDKTLVRELYVFWLGDAEDRPSVLSNSTRLEDLEYAGCGVFNWESFESSSIQFDLFIRERCSPDWGVAFISEISTKSVRKPVIKYQSLRPLSSFDFSSTSEEVQVLLVPTGIRATLLPYRRYESDDIAVVLNEFKTLFGLDLSNLEDDISIPPLVHIRITYDNTTKELPYPAKGIYVITDINNSYRWEAQDSGMLPEVFSNVIEQRSKPSERWQYSDHSKDITQILKHKNPNDLNASSPGVDTMTPNTPGMGNGTSSASSPGHSLGANRSSKKRSSGETKAYPSPPDVMPSNDVQLQQLQNDEILHLPDLSALESEIMLDYIDIEGEIMQSDFDSFDKNPQTISSTTNYHTTSPYLSTTNEDSPSIVQNQTTLVEHNQQKIDHEIKLEISKVKFRYCPEDYSPLIFHNEVDMSKYMPGGKFCHSTNRKKRKRDFLYTPEYKPAWVVEAKKSKSSDDNSNQFYRQKRHKKEDYEYSSSERNTHCTSESSESESSESETETDSDSDLEFDALANNFDVSNRRELDFLNAGRLSMIFNVYDLHERRQLRRSTDREVCNDKLSKLALQFLREQIVGGSYPFGAGIHGDGESTFEFIESRRRILEILDGDLPTSSALPSERQEITMSLKKAVEEISDQFPLPEKHSKLSVIGPLSVQDYYNLNATDNKDSEPNFQAFKTPDVIVCADEFLIETSPEIVKYWDKHNLTPFADRKDIKYFVFYPDSESLKFHLHCVLGKHEPATMKSFKQGMVPIQLASSQETELDRMIRSYETTCDNFGRSLAPLIDNSGKTQLVIYLVNPFDHPTASYDIFKCYAKLYTSLENSLKSVSKNGLNNVIPQLIPIDHIVRFDKNCIRPFKLRPVLRDLAFSVYTRSKSYRPLFILPKPSVVSVSFQLSKKAPPVKELVKYNKILHMCYGFSFDQRICIIVWVDMEGKRLGSYSIPTYDNKNQTSLESLYREAWSRTCAFIWVEVTKGIMPIFSVNLDTAFDIKPTLDENVQNSKVFGMVLSNPIPSKDFRSEMTGFLIEMNNNEAVFNTIQVDLLYNPGNDNKSTTVMWDVLNQFHVLSFMEVATTRKCLPIHVLMVERCCREYLGVPT
ncbi:14146_t:CDS:10 [Funneliformis caledonium]|uniref:Mediator of RNA polymerase II transcription subunit 13 n=1 Tax=Funneliformis caledonium TaxID=1117310 RepID=A0A9N8VP78_9GLOM|nr:14146_t:CDS:10 [Funneliformis caledonium]